VYAMCRTGVYWKWARRSQHTAVGGVALTCCGSDVQPPPMPRTLAARDAR